MLSLGVQYWTSRGFAVVDVDYGGSSGYGRPYRELLRGQWGVVDVADCLAAARALADRGRVDVNRLCIRGGSAGGRSSPGQAGTAPSRRHPATMASNSSAAGSPPGPSGSRFTRPPTPLVTPGTPS